MNHTDDVYDRTFDAPVELPVRVSIVLPLQRGGAHVDEVKRICSAMAARLRVRTARRGRASTDTTLNVSETPRGSIHTCG